MKITFISDTHTKHSQLNLPGGDILIHAGDLMNSGYNQGDIYSFLDWFSSQPYTHKIFIAGNHDRMFEYKPEFVRNLLKDSEYDEVTYLEDEEIIIDGVKIYGSPWQPEFYDWAFNLPRCGKELEEKWSNIPEDTDILVTHGPPQGYLDMSGAPYNEPNLGCELLRVRVDKIKPKIHTFGHIHGGSGYKTNGHTHFINAAVLGEDYKLTCDGYTITFDHQNNDINFIA